jgi:hypothetical protein
VSVGAAVQVPLTKQFNSSSTISSLHQPLVHQLPLHFQFLPTSTLISVECKTSAHNFSNKLFESTICSCK